MKIDFHPRVAVLSFAVSRRPLHIAIGFLFWTLHFGEQGEGPETIKTHKVDHDNK